MASISKAAAAHATLTGTTADTVTLTQGFNAVEVINRSTAGISVTYGANAADVPTPTLLGDNTLYVPPGAVVTLDANGRGNFTVKVVGDGDAYSVQGVDG